MKIKLSMIKQNLLTVFFLFFALSTIAQTGVTYFYDDAGNRYKRSKTPLRIGKEDPIVDTVGAYSFSFFPNPTSGNLTVQVDQEFMKLEDKNAYLYDLNGRKLQEKIVTSNSMPFDLSTYPFGIYILRVTSKGYSSEWKVIKE